MSVRSARETFFNDIVEKLAPHIDAPAEQLADSARQPLPEKWDPVRRRQPGRDIPARLWESVIPTSEDAQIARRPLAVSVKDNIDLFQTAKKDETEPVFAA